MDGAFRAKISPHKELGASAPAVVGLPLNWAILRFISKELGGANAPPYPMPGLFAIRNGARGNEGARVEN
jgi:hypothetical protein